MDMKTICKTATILDGKVTVYMLPYNTMQAGRVIDEMDTLTDLFPEHDERQYWMHIFRLMEQFLIDLEFEPSANSHVEGLKLYWQNRNGDMSQRAELFPTVVSTDVMALLFGAYEETREALPGVSDVLAAGKPDAKTDPEATSGGGQK
ncbi:hypothetical protein LCGC14_2783350 [marine sediment metagenome]|uniref:Uncharacterized protein n=1 Tax=marine sediment metagenome TaxID=412755 RepID=A0A0F9BJ72_9ZZZZ